MKRFFLSLIFLGALVGTAHTATIRCGDVTTLETAINAACQADRTSVTTALLTCAAHEVTAQDGSTYSYIFKYTYGSATHVGVWVDESGGDDNWSPYTQYLDSTDPNYVSEQPTFLHTTGGAAGMFTFKFKPSTRFFRVAAYGVGSDPNDPNDAFVDVKVCVANE